jgi:hypothetical protein
MSKFLKLFLFFCFVVLGFTAQKAFAFTCTAVAAGGNWNAAATWSGSCNSTTPQNGDDVVIDGTMTGTVTVNVSTANLKSLDMTGNGGTVAGSSAITVTGLTATTQNVIFDGIISWTGTLNLNPATATADINLTTNTKLLTLVSLGGSAADVVLQDNLSFTAAKTNTLTIGAPLLNMNGFTISGQSAINRLLLTSSVLGTQRTITRSSGAFAYADFMDIDLEASYDCSAITGLCGDAGGNSADFTFTTGVTNYWIGNAGNWSDVNEWASSPGGSAASGRVPLPQDDATFDNSSFSGNNTVTMDMPRSARTIDASAYNEANTPILTPSVSTSIYGSLTLNSLITWSTSSTVMFRGRGSYTLTSAGKSFGSAVQILIPGGTLTLLDAFSQTAGTLFHQNGTFDANDLSVTAPVYSHNGVTATKVLVMGSGTWTLTGTGNIWAWTASGSTLTEETSTIVFSNTTATSKTFIGAGETYNNVTWTGQNINITGNNTFTVMAFENATTSVATTVGVRFTGASTTTITSNLTSNGSAGVLAIATSTNASIWEINKTGGGTVCTDFMSIARSLATPVSTWYAGANSTDVGLNTGWTFTACPGGSEASTGFIDINGSAGSVEITGSGGGVIITGQ